MSENISGEFLKSLRKEKKMSQKKLADLAGISQSALVKYEKGTRKIPKDVDDTLSKILNVETLLKDEKDRVGLLIDQLIAYRDMNELLNKELATKVGTSEVSLSYVLNGKRKPSKDVQQKIAVFLSNDGKEILMDIKQDDGSFKLPIVDKIAMGKRIQGIRKNRGETLEKFGKNFTRPAGKNVVNRWEKGTNIPDIERLMNVAYLGKVTVSYILYGYIYSKMLKEGNKVNQLEKLVPFRMGVVSYFVLLIILVLLFRIFSTVSIFPTPIQA
ncbi:helix-turn-helix domain-containing protein [Enterococcus durans]|uniref:helix-turn-helix domain-containing protein n=1 Tax=Enterococcus durans TaxID=53345 RepID=UPI001F0D7601|nr:helix-turn-helix transcriptional regulator [Enterococcus durans]